MVQRHGNNFIRIYLGFPAIGRIKYPRMLPVYLSDMRALVERNPNIWQFILDGHFSVQISNILGTAKDRDHAGKQENKKMKIQSGLIVIVRREKSRNKFFPIWHMVSETEKELREIPHSQKKEIKIHHALNQNKISIPSKNATFGNVKL